MRLGLGRTGLGAAVLAALGIAIGAAAALPDADARPARPRAAASNASTSNAFRLRMLAADAAGGADGAISPSGDAFVTSSRRSGNLELWLYEMGSGAWRQLTDDPGEDFEAEWAPDGRRLVFTSTRTGQKDLWTLDVPTGALHRLTFDEEDDEYPRWSPDGRWIVYTGGAWGQNHFYVVPSAGGTPRRVTRTAGHGGACSFAPDGGALICHRYASGSGDLFRIGLDGSETALTSGPAWDYKPNPSPDGRWIAYTRTDEGPSAIELMPAGGGPGTAIANSGHPDRWPGWTSSSDRLFFHRLVEEGTAVRLLDRATGAVRTLVEGDERPLQAALDPAGTRVAFCAQREGHTVVRVRDLASGATRTVAGEGRGACSPRWSPDGRTLAFALRDAERWEIATIGADGAGLRVWTAGRAGLAGMDGPMDWSPDGRMIVFQSDTRAFESDLYVLDTADGTLRNLTQDAWWDEAPSWSPDGRSVLYMSTRGGGWTWGLYRISVADGSVTVVSAPGYVEKNYPRMAGDGRVVWAYRDSAGAERLAEQPAGGSRGAPLAAEAGARWPSYSADGRGVLYTVVQSRTEFWVAENPAGPGSPVLRPAGGGGGGRAMRGGALPALAARFSLLPLMRGRMVDVRSEWRQRDRSPADKHRR
jgi:TolB protein